MDPWSAACVGYRMLSRDGGVFTFGDAPFYGAPGAVDGDEWVAFASTPEDRGYVMVTSGGVVHGYGDAEDAEVMRGDGPPTADVVDVEWLRTRSGFRILDRSGGIFCFGDADFHGSIPGISPTVDAALAVAMASTPTGNGYWILDEAGGVYAFGDADFHGSVPGLRLDAPSAPAVDLIAVPGRTTGYRILEADGTIRSFGAVPSVSEDGAGGRPVVTFASATDGGCVVVDARGLVFPVGTAPMLGSLASVQLAAPVVDVRTVHTRSSAS